MASLHPVTPNDVHPYRSGGEAQIARCLNRYHIPYLYEHPLAVVDRGHTRIWYPDFQLTGYGILIEYCGRIGDLNYTNGMVRKQKVYQANGLTAIMLYPEVFRGDWPEAILHRIEDTLMDRLTRFQRTPGRLVPSRRRG